MYVKLSKQGFGYLMQNCKFIKSMSIVYENNTLVKISIDEKEADDIREWALDELEFKGFDENYELNKNGQILERLVDLFFRQNKSINSRGYFIVVSKPKQITEGVSYQFGNFIYDPKNINISMKSIDFIEGYLPGIPSTTKAGIGGWLVYQSLHPKEFYDGVITNYDAIKSVFVDKEKK